MSSKVSFYEKFSLFLEEKLMPVASKIANQRHLKAVRDGMISIVPLTIVGGLSLILAFPPIDPERTQGTNFFLKAMLGWHKWAQNNFSEIMMPFNMTMAIMSLFVAIAIGYSLSKAYNINPLSGAILSGTTFLLVSAPAQNSVALSKIKEGMDLKAIQALGEGVLPSSYLDAKGLFTAIIIGLLSIEVMRFLKEKNFTIKMPDGVPPAVASSFEALVPLIVNVILFYAISLIFQKAFQMIIPEAIMKALTPAMNAVDSALAIFLISCLSQLLWFVGLHGAAITGAIRDPFVNANLMLNANEKLANTPMTHVFTGPFWSYFIVIGGSGATLALVFLMLKSRSSHLKSVGKVALLPALFNINEPIIFGAPMVLNPIFAIPFIFIQGINGVLAYYVVKLGMVGKAFINTPWTTPAPIGAFLSTMDWKALVLVIALAVLDGFLFYPFYKVYEKAMIKQQEASQEMAVDNSTKSM